MLVLPNGLSTVQITESLSRAEVKAFVDFEAVCRHRGLRFALYCNLCKEAGMLDGVRGNNDSNDSQYMIECGHSKRVYLSGMTRG